MHLEGPGGRGAYGAGPDPPLPLRGGGLEAKKEFVYLKSTSIFGPALINDSSEPIPIRCLEYHLMSRVR